MRRTLPHILLASLLLTAASSFAQLEGGIRPPGGPPPPGGGPCAADADCNDGNLCTRDVCIPLKGCQNVADDSITQDCSTGLAGICGDGLRRCVNGKLEACQALESPSDEICDNLDNDCDGLTDEEISESCYNGPAATRGVGICQDGRRVCEKGAFGECAGQTLPLPKEVCGNGMDDNCDGQTDEGCCGNGFLDAGELCDEGAANGRVGHCSALCQPPDCDDGNLCTDDLYDPERGCLNNPNNNPCDDKNVCTFGDVCQNGSCRGRADPRVGQSCGEGIDPVCNEGKFQCVGGDIRCIALPKENGTPCGDGLFCNGEETCQSGRCEALVPAGDPAQEGQGCVAGEGLCQGSGILVCDENSDRYLCNAVPQADGTECSDNNLCNGNEICRDGACQGGEALACDDGNRCTDDGCDPALGCRFTPNSHQEPCYEGPPETRNVGICREGIARCANGLLGACEEQVFPEAEDICANGLDDDCDGDTDEGCCGNSILEEGEICDGILGVGPNQACSADCRIIPLDFCGDGVKNGEEDCDGREGVGPHQECSEQCVLVDQSWCGDGKVQSPNDNGVAEECDPGLQSAGAGPGLQSAGAGPGLQSAGAGGAAGLSPHQTCDDKCRLTDLTHCGDGVVQNPNDEGVRESCDGETGVGAHQACSPDCQVIQKTYCGDGIVQNPNDEGIAEKCDSSAGVGPHQACSAACDLLNLSYCGDGKVQFPNDEGIREECDPGLQSAGAGPGLQSAGAGGAVGLGAHQACSVDCKKVDLAFCGDGIKNQNEECDPGLQSAGAGGADGPGAHQRCSEKCTLITETYCGDGILQRPNNKDLFEECDPGLQSAGAGGTAGVGAHQQCSEGCTLMDLSWCGDGLVQSPNDEGQAEECDATAGVGPNQACSSECRLIALERCGDGVRNGNEECDGSDGVGEHQHCSAVCALVAETWCGDGLLQRPNDNDLMEECDPGLQSAGAGGTAGVGPHQECSEGCTLISRSWCGDGVLQNPNDEGIAEECDQTAGVGRNQRCSEQCRIVASAFCGDGIRQSPNDNDLMEECDPGLQSAGAGGADGVGEHEACSEGCTRVALTWCGDGIVQSPNDGGVFEHCDGAAGLNAHERCRAGCEREYLTYCGDGVVQNPNDEGVEEACDGRAGLLAHQECSATCGRIDHTFCGDGIVQSPNEEGLVEECDGASGIGLHERCSEGCTRIRLNWCGDGRVDRPNDDGQMEECDPPLIQAAHIPGLREPPGRICDRAVCRWADLPRCGDGIVNAGEECDDGNNNPADDCVDCRTAVCGDRVIRVGVEECDDGFGVNNDVVAGACKNDCSGIVEEREPEKRPGLAKAKPICGNGILEPGESCDDGNLEEGDGCSALCEMKPLQKAQEAPPPEPIPPLPFCGSDIFDCEKTCSVWSPYLDVLGAAVIRPDRFEDQMLVFSGSNNEAAGLAFRATREIPDDCAFAFRHCELNTRKWTHLAAAALDGPEADDLVGITDDLRFFHLLNFPETVRRLPAGPCALRPELLSDSVENERAWVNWEGMARLGVVEEILDLKTFPGGDSPGSVLAASRLEVPAVGGNFQAVGVDHLAFRAGQRFFSHRFIPVVEMDLNTTVNQARLDLPDHGPLSRFTLWVETEEDDATQTAVFDCLANEQEWECREVTVLSNVSPLLIVPKEDLLKRLGEEASDEENADRVLISREGDLFDLDVEVEETDDEEGEEDHGRRPFREKRAKKAKKVGHASAGGEADRHFNPRRERQHAAHAWLQPDSHNTALPEQEGVQGYALRMDEAEELHLERLENERLTAEAPLNRVANDQMRYRNPKLVLPLLRNNYGGTDLVSFFDAYEAEDLKMEFKEGTMVSLFHNRNEAPEIALEKSAIEGERATLNVFPKDVMEDPLDCETSLEDAQGANMKHLIVSADCGTVVIDTSSVLDPNYQIDASVSKSTAKSSISGAAASFPLSGSVCATDPGDLSACAKFSVSKSGGLAEIEIPAPAAAAASSPAVEGSSPVYSVRGGGCGGIIARAGSNEFLWNWNAFLPFGLLIFLSALRFRRKT